MSTTDPATPALPTALRLGPVHLVVADLARARHWYTHHLGLHVMSEEGETVQLGDGSQSVLVLTEDRAASAPGAEAGLYHVALLYPSRQELARAAMRLATYRTPIEGASDHRTHEAIYLSDSEGNGLELAADRPRDQWPADLGYGRGPDPLDVANLLATIDGESLTPQISDGLRTGHLHLHVGDVDQAIAFYRDVLGFHVTANLGSAVFFAAGDYHHHLGANVWRGRGVGAVSAHVVGLGHWNVVLPTPEDVAQVAERARTAGAPVIEMDGAVTIADPWGMRLQLTAAPR
jgi:catechol 2,3-dioxygenase